MTIKNILTSGLILGVMAVATSCGGSQPLVDPTVELAYSKEPTAANLENLAKAYGSTINKNRKTGEKQPGLYSDYAVALVKQGRRAEANSWFNKEMAEYPVSRAYVMQLKRQLIPEYQDNNAINMNEANEEATSLPPATRAAAEERASEVREGTTPEAEAGTEAGTEAENETEMETETEPAPEAAGETEAKTGNGSEENAAEEVEKN